ncbi:MAG: hypothetical protein L0206_22145, partial [Actinobacteria bacterium]|nr:hypothetical protein [Actinomycetota bacterium]
DRTWLTGLPAAERAAARPRVEAAAARRAGRSRSLDLGGEGLEVVNVVGWGEATVDRAEIAADGSSVRFLERSATDPADTLGYEGGDATAPRRSAAWLQPGGNVRVATYHLPVGWLSDLKKHFHATLWRNPGGRNLLRHHLGGAPLEPFAYAALDSRDSGPDSDSVEVRVRAVALDAAGRPLAGAQLRTRDLRPPGGQLTQPFDPANGGRHVMAVPRARMRSVAVNQGRVFHLEVEITWDEGGAPRTTGRIPFAFLQRS